MILTGWKAILECSKANGGPSSERHLRRLAYKGAPIYAPVGGGAVQADDGALMGWLKSRLVHLSARPLSERVRVSPTTATRVAKQKPKPSRRSPHKSSSNTPKRGHS